jgi:hypothetical protein
MAVFGQPVVFETPVAMPDGTGNGRGSWSFKPVQIALENGTTHSTNQPCLGVKLADFTVAPRQSNFVTVAGTRYEIVDTLLDGQGGADLLLREADPL